LPILEKVVLRLSEHGDVIETQKIKVCTPQRFLANSVIGDAATPAPLTRPIECRTMGGRVVGVPPYVYPHDIFEVDKIFFKYYFQKNQLSTPDSQPK